MTRRAPQPIGADFDWIEPAIRRAQANPRFLRDADIRFIDSLWPRLKRYGADAYMSAKQREWARDIAKRLDKAGVGPDGARNHGAPEGARNHGAPEGARNHGGPDGEEPGDPVARPVDEVIR